MSVARVPRCPDRRIAGSVFPRSMKITPPCSSGCVSTVFP